MKLVHEENYTMSEKFSQKNLLPCGMQGNNGLLGNLSKNVQNHLHGQPVLTFNKRQICSASCEMFEWTLIELPSTYK